MNRNKNPGKEKKVRIKLSLEERKLILGDPIRIPQAFVDSIRATPAGAPVLLTVDELEDLGGHVAAEANRTTDRKLRNKLNTIFSKIQDLLETHADAPLPKSLKIEDAQRQKLLADEGVQLAEWAATMLIGAEQLGIKDKPVGQFSLPWAERAVLLLCTDSDKNVLEKLGTEKPNVTVGELGALLMAVAEAMIDAPSSQCHALSMTAKSLMACLEEEVTAH